MQDPKPEHICPVGNCPFCDASFCFAPYFVYERIPVVEDPGLIIFFNENGLREYGNVVSRALKVNDLAGLKKISFTQFENVCETRLSCLPTHVYRVLSDIFDVWTTEREKNSETSRKRERELEEDLEHERLDRMWRQSVQIHKDAEIATAAKRRALGAAAAPTDV